MTKRKSTPAVRVEGSPEYDDEEFKKIAQRSGDLASDFSKRDTMFDEVDQVYWLDWLDEKPKTTEGDVKLTIAPDPADKVQGAHRLLSAAEPNFNIKTDENAPDVASVADEIKQFAKVMWQASGRFYGKPIESDLSLQALLYSQCHLGVVSMADLLTEAERSGDQIQVMRVKRAMLSTPYLFEPFWPRGGYPEFDRLGLTGYLRSYEATVGSLEDEHGEDAVKDALGTYKRSHRVVVRDWYDLRWRAKWIHQGVGKTSKAVPGGPPLLMKRHGLSFLPVVVQMVEGSAMWGKAEWMSRPWLYNLIKSGMWKRANLAYTVLYTILFAIAQNALFKHGKPPGKGEKKLEVDWARLGAGIIELESGETFDAMFQKGAIDPAIVQAVALAEEKMTQSTIHGQALGEPLGANAPFSMVALLHQAGRLPLLPAQKLTGFAIASAAEMALEWMRNGKVKGEARYGGTSATLDYSIIPEVLHIDVKVDIDLSQDKVASLQQALAGQAGGLVSMEWVREELLHIGQSENMDEDIWSEGMAKELVARLFRQLQAPPAPPVPPGGGGRGGGGGASLPAPSSGEPELPVDGANGIPMAEPVTPAGMPPLPPAPPGAA